MRWVAKNPITDRHDLVIEPGTVSMGLLIDKSNGCFTVKI